MEKTYIAIDLKSFYASVECVNRNLDPLQTNLVVADTSRTEKTICLAVSPSLKAYGIPGRARLFEVISKVKEVNRERLSKIPSHKFTGKSTNAIELAKDPTLALDFIAAIPQMGKYMEISTKIFSIYMKYVSSEDIHVYSIDEVFIDVTEYLPSYHMTAHELAMKMIQDVLSQTGVTATAGIGTNLYLAKIAMDIVAKHIPADKDGVRIAELNELSYRELLWDHRPITSFWRVGKGTAKRLEKLGLFTMGDVAEYSLCYEDKLYEVLGINAELLIDHAWGWEPTTMKDIKSYKPGSNSLSSGQVLSTPYSFEKGLLILTEMTDLLVLDLVEKELVCDQIVIQIGYDVENLEKYPDYSGPTTIDFYGRQIPKPAHGSINLPRQTSSTKIIMEAVRELYAKTVDPALTIRRLNVVANHIIPSKDAKKPNTTRQMDFFTDYEEEERKEQQIEATLQEEHQLQKAILNIQKKYGKNSVLKGMNFEDGATTKERNSQIGGHKA